MITLRGLLGERRAFAWMDRANCAGMWWLFDPGADEDQQAEALDLCAACPVKPRCEQHAEVIGANEGVWAGQVRISRHECAGGCGRTVAAGAVHCQKCSRAAPPLLSCKWCGGDVPPGRKVYCRDECSDQAYLECRRQIRRDAAARAAS